MSAARQLDLRAALRLVRDLEGASSPAAVRAAVRADLPRVIGRDPPWATLDPTTLRARDAAAFDEAELALLELLQPHVRAALRRTAEAERLAALQLTPREQAVLDRVAAGDPNAAIAHRLRMRPRTVEKHLEHAYAKLGVSSRTAAVATLRQISG